MPAPFSADMRSPPHAHIHRVCTYIYTQEKPPEEKIVYVDVPVEKIVEKIVRSAPSESRPRPPAPARARPLVTESGAVSLARFLQCDVRVQGGGASHPVRHAPGSTAQVEVPVYVEKEVIKEVEKPVFVDKVQVFPCCRLRTTH